MKTRIVIYLENHAVAYRCVRDLPQRIRPQVPTCLLVETSPRSFKMRVLKEYLEHLKRGFVHPIDYYAAQAWRARWYWKETFARSLFFAGYLFRHQNFVDAYGIDPRISNLRFSDFQQCDTFFTKALQHRGALLHRRFLEEHAFVAWFVNERVKKLEAKGLRQFVCSVGSLHYASFRRYLAAPHRDIQFVRIPLPHDKKVRLIRGTDASVLRFLARGDKQSDAWLLHKFFT